MGCLAGGPVCREAGGWEALEGRPAGGLGWGKAGGQETLGPGTPGGAAGRPVAGPGKININQHTFYIVFYIKSL